MRKTFKGLKITGLTLLGCLVLGGASPAAYASGNLWYDKYVALDTAIGNSFYNDSNSTNLAYGESYVLESYLDVYQLTKNTAWLDKMVTHIDTMISNAHDLDNDGYLGWDTARYSPQKIQNTGFETAASGDSTMAANWTRYQSNSSTAYRNTGSVYAGSYSFALKTNGTSWQKAYQPISSYYPGMRYRLSLQGITNGSAAGGQAYIYDATDGVKLANINFNNTSFTYYEADFTAPAVAGHNLQVWLGHQSYSVPNGTAVFDDVEVSMYSPYAHHDGMVGLALSKFYKLIATTPSLQTAYLTKANNYKTFLETNIIPKWITNTVYGNSWTTSGASEGYYRLTPLKDTYANYPPNTIQGYDVQSTNSMMQKHLYDVTGTSAYQDRFTRTSNFFKNNLTLSGTAYDWDLLYGGRVEDTSHAEVDLEAVLEMYRSGLIYTGTDMDRFTNTLTDVMWNQSLTSPTVSHFVDGTGATDFSRLLINWTELAQFDSRVWSIAAEQYRSFTPSIATDMQVLSQIMRWDPEKIANNGFEYKSSTDATLPARWLRGAGSTSTSVYLDNVQKNAGQFGLTVASTTSTSAWQMLYQDWKGWSPSTSYTVSFDAKTDGGLAGGRFFIKDSTTGVTLGSGLIDFDNTSWQTRTMTFTSPANASDTVRIYLENHSLNQNGKASFDNVVIKRTGDAW